MPSATVVSEDSPSITSAYLSTSSKAPACQASGMGTMICARCLVKHFRFWSTCHLILKARFIIPICQGGKCDLDTHSLWLLVTWPKNRGVKDASLDLLDGYTCYALPENIHLIEKPCESIKLHTSCWSSLTTNTDWGEPCAAEWRTQALNFNDFAFVFLVGIWDRQCSSCHIFCSAPEPCSDRFLINVHWLMLQAQKDLKPKWESKWHLALRYRPLPLLLQVITCPSPGR